MEEQLRVISWNCNGLTKDRREDPGFVELLSSYDIVFINESWCSSNSDVQLSGSSHFNIYRTFQHKNARRKGGA